MRPTRSRAHTAFRRRFRGSKMSSAGPGWQWNARTQIRWGMRYIQARYRTPYWAWRQQHAYGWY